MEQRINGHTRLYALIGSPVGHSGSPAMYNYSFAKLGLDCAYLAFDIPVEKTGAAIEAFRTLNVGGFNITMPDINISTNVSTVVNVDEDHSRTTTTTTPAAGNSHDGSLGVSDLGDLLTGLDRLFK